MKTFLEAVVAIEAMAVENLSLAASKAFVIVADAKGVADFTFGTKREFWFCYGQFELKPRS